MEHDIFGQNRENDNGDKNFRPVEDLFEDIVLQDILPNVVPNVVSDTVTIQTHDKRFHADEVGAISLLTSYFNSKNIKVRVIRSRDEELMKQADILVDVGGVYSHEFQKYDHHQDNCEETFSEHTKIPLSSIGFIWKHYGKELLRSYIDCVPEFKNKLETTPVINTAQGHSDSSQDHIENLYTEIYLKLIQEIDAHDNGVPIIEGGIRKFWPNMYLPSIISAMNSPNKHDDVSQMSAFENAVNLFGTIFEIKLREKITKYFEYHGSYSTVRSYLAESPNKEYIITTEIHRTIFKCLNSLDPQNRIKFVIFGTTDPTAGDQFTVRTRNVPDNFYTPLVPLLPQKILKEKLSQDGLDPDDIIFIDRGLIMAKVGTLETATAIIKYSLDEFGLRITEQSYDGSERSFPTTDEILSTPLSDTIPVGYNLTRNIYGDPNKNAESPTQACSFYPKSTRSFIMTEMNYLWLGFGALAVGIVGGFLYTKQ